MENTEMPFDEEELMEEYDGDKDILARMREIFDRDCQDRLPKIRDAIQAGDCETLTSEAHALKGGLGTFFATASFETAYKLEVMGHDKETSDAAATFSQLETELQSFRQALNELIGKL